MTISANFSQSSMFSDDIANKLIVNRKRHWVMVICLVLHTILISALFHASQTPHIDQNLRRLLIQLLPPTMPKVEEKKSIATAKPAVTKLQVQAISEKIIKPIETKPEQTVAETKPIDPFAVQTTPVPATNSAESFRQNAGQIWHELEKENPIRKQLDGKKNLTPIEKFAKHVLDSAPERGLTMKEEIRADGSRMTRVKSTGGEFCVLAPQPGRTYDLRIGLGGEKRIMQVCPIEF